MQTSVDQLITPRVLVVDDEKSIHASIRLRLDDSYQLICSSDPREALERIRDHRFDLCVVDLHMPKMNGLEFVEAAKQIDPPLGFVILTGHGTEENLRNAIPLQVFDFILKPLADRTKFERRVPDWISQTRSRRREMELLKSSGTLARELDAAQIARDIEFTASESARDALLQSANLLTTIHAQLVTACHAIEIREKHDPSFRVIARGLHEARKAADAATNITEAFFNTAYANRDESPAVLGPALRDSINMCLRWTRAEFAQKQVDASGSELNAVVEGLSGIELLLLLIPALSAAIESAAPGTTVQVRVEGLGRLEAAPRMIGLRELLWVNRRYAAESHVGVLLRIRTKAPAMEHAHVKQWLEGGQSVGTRLPAGSMLRGLTKCRGMMGVSVVPAHAHFELALVLPT